MWRPAPDARFLLLSLSSLFLEADSSSLTSEYRMPTKHCLVLTTPGVGIADGSFSQAAEDRNSGSHAHERGTDPTDPSLQSLGLILNDD